MARVTKAQTRRPLAADAAGGAAATSISHALLVQRLLRAHRPRPATSISVTSSSGAASAAPTEPVEVTRPVLERYQRHLFHHRKKNGEPLSFRSQHALLVAAARVVPMDDAAEPHPAQPGLGAGAAPAGPHRLPKHVLNAQEVEQVLQQPRHRRSYRAARPGDPGGPVLDRDAAHGGGRAETLRPRPRPRHCPRPAGQGQQRPLRADRRTGRSRG